MELIPITMESQPFIKVNIIGFWFSNNWVCYFIYLGWMQRFLKLMCKDSKLDILGVPPFCLIGCSFFLLTTHSNCLSWVKWLLKSVEWLGGKEAFTSPTFTGQVPKMTKGALARLLIIEICREFGPKGYWKPSGRATCLWAWFSLVSK